MSSTAAAATLENVLYEKKGAIAFVTVSRPEVLNALHASTLQDLRTASEDARGDAAVRGVILHATHAATHRTRSRAPSHPYRRQDRRTRGLSHRPGERYCVRRRASRARGSDSAADLRQRPGRREVRAGGRKQGTRDQPGRRSG